MYIPEGYFNYAPMQTAHPSTSLAVSACGTRFTGNGLYIMEAYLMLQRVGNLPNATLSAAIYAYNGTNTPSTLLATSKPIPANNIYPYHEDVGVFEFQNIVKSVSGGSYILVLTLQGTGIDTSNYIYSVCSDTDGGADQSCLYYQNGTWNNKADNRLIFVVLGTEDEPPTSSVKYMGLGQSGTVPIDNFQYIYGATVVVQANPGGLVIEGYQLLGWAYNKIDPIPHHLIVGTSVIPPTFTIEGSDVVLHAIWKPIQTKTLTTTAVLAESLNRQTQISRNQPIQTSLSAEFTRSSLLKRTLTVGSTLVAAVDRLLICLCSFSVSLNVSTHTTRLTSALRSFPAALDISAKIARQIHILRQIIPTLGIKAGLWRLFFGNRHINTKSHLQATPNRNIYATRQFSAKLYPSSTLKRLTIAIRSLKVKTVLDVLVMGLRLAALREVVFGVAISLQTKFKRQQTLTRQTPQTLNLHTTLNRYYIAIRALSAGPIWLLSKLVSQLSQKIRTALKLSEQQKHPHIVEQTKQPNIVEEIP